MKKWALLLLFTLIFSTTAFADHAQDSLALGGIFGAGVSWNGYISHPDFYPAGLSLKIPGVPLFWGVYVKPFDNLWLGIPGYGLGLGITGDWYFAEPGLVSKTATNQKGSYNLKIDWYVGAGFYANMYMRDNYFRGDGGFRMPFGVSWHAMGNPKQLEVCVGSVGGLGIGSDNHRDKPYVHIFFIPVEVTVRWWFA
jgi:hypothetical protein